MPSIDIYQARKSHPKQMMKIILLVIMVKCPVVFLALHKRKQNHRLQHSKELRGTRRSTIGSEKKTSLSVSLMAINMLFIVFLARRIFSVVTWVEVMLNSIVNQLHIK